jgi:N-acetylglucosaminyldiphosphoundecaprenol N-acetyl-beta-D-mannosaminyltransferase
VLSNSNRDPRYSFGRTRQLAGIPVRISDPAAAREEIVDLSVSGNSFGTAVHLVNAYTLALSYHNSDYARVLRKSDFNFPDGKPLMWATRFTSNPLQQVRGPRFFEDVVEGGRSKNVKHFLLGGTDATLALLVKRLEQKYAGVQIVGTYSPPFRTLTDSEVERQDEIIRGSGADVVWVGLGTPKQDYEVQRIAEVMPVIACAVGAAFDFSAGTKKEAPSWVASIGFEWLFRFASEPRRLWRRYLIGNVVFIWAVIRGGKGT